MSQSTNTKHNGYTFTADYGTRIGNYHRKGLSNNMDAVYLHKGSQVVVGGVADGCGGTGEHSEVSALLFIPWLVDRMHSLLESPTGLTGKSISEASKQLWYEYIPKLQSILDFRYSGMEKPDLITQREYLDQIMLHTVVLYVVIFNQENDYWDCYFVYRGDGYIVIDDQMVNLESLEETKHNGVLYPALALSAYQQWLKTTTPTTAELATRSFDIVHIGNSRKNWHRIAVSSDGLRFLHNGQLDRYVFPEFKPLDPNPAPGVKQVTSITEAINWGVKDVDISPDDDMGIVNFKTFPPPSAPEPVVISERVTSEPVPTVEEMAGEDSLEPVDVPTSNELSLNETEIQEKRGIDDSDKGVFYL